MNCPDWPLTFDHPSVPLEHGEHPDGDGAVDLGKLPHAHGVIERRRRQLERSATCRATWGREAAVLVNIERAGDKTQIPHMRHPLSPAVFLDISGFIFPPGGPHETSTTSPLWPEAVATHLAK